jgi:multicomponent Na+:H+ antiporter subunit F
MMLNLALVVVLPLLMLTTALVVIRLVRGPSLPDRVIALDLLATISMGIIAVYAVAVDQPVLLDAAVVLALLSFLGTVAFAYYLQQRV